MSARLTVGRAPPTMPATAALSHLAFFEALASETDERSTRWRQLSAGLLTLRAFDAWLQHARRGDSAPDAYEKVVDRMLASPAYGEHRARYWLDAARYADTHGLHFGGNGRGVLGDVLDVRPAGCQGQPAVGRDDHALARLDRQQVAAARACSSMGGFRSVADRKWSRGNGASRRPAYPDTPRARGHR